jgi:hypothetical protein
MPIRVTIYFENFSEMHHIERFLNENNPPVTVFFKGIPTPGLFMRNIGTGTPTNYNFSRKNRFFGTKFTHKK